MKCPSLLKLVTVLLALQVLPCHAGWRDSLREDAFKPLAKQPVVETLSSNRNGVLVKVKNEGEASLHYSSESPAGIAVMIEEYKEGKWVSERWSSCGSGVKQWEIQPGQTVELNLPVLIDQVPTKIYAIFGGDAGTRSLVLLHEKK